MAIVGKSNTKATKEGGFFEGCRFIVELGVLPQSKKKELFLSIEANGGVLDFVISKKTTHVITNEASLLLYKLKSAHTHGCFIVSEDYLSACLDANKRVDEWQYMFLGETPASSLGNYKDAASYVGTHVAQAFAGVSAVMNVVYPSRVNEAVAEGVLRDVAALCAGLGARVPDGKFPLKSIVNNLYFNVLFNKARKPVEPEVVQPIMVQPPYKSIVPTPLFREISPKPQSLSSPYTRPTSSTLSSLSSTSTSSSSSSSASKKSYVKPSVESSLSKPASQSSFSAQSPRPPAVSSTSAFSSSLRPATSTPFSFSSRTSPSTAPAPSTSATLANAAPKSTVSYSYAQYEAERRKKREDEKAQRSQESGSVLRERETRRKEEEEQRKKEQEEKRLEVLERRKQEDEDRKQKNREITEAREKRISEERKKREQALERLRQKAPHDLLTTSFFQQLDQEENNKRMQEEWAQYLYTYMKEVEAAQKQEEDKERAEREKADRLFAEKERKIQEREEQAKLAASERTALKARRREEYENNKTSEATKKQQEFEERQAKLLAAFMKRQERRARKQLGKEGHEIQKNYDEQKIFVGGIKVDDIKAAKFKPDFAERVLAERMNAILRMFDQFGPVHKRKVFAEKGHCFITFEDKESVDKAVSFMKDAETRKKLVEEAKEAQKEHNMNPLCAPHPQFYVRAPNLKNKRKPKQQTTSAPIDEGAPFTEVKKSKAQPKPSAASPFLPTPSTLSVPSVPTLPSASPLAHDDTPVALGAEGERPARIPTRPRFLTKPRPMRVIKAPEEPDLNDVDSFPRSKNAFDLLDDDEE